MIMFYFYDNCLKPMNLNPDLLKMQPALEAKRRKQIEVESCFDFSGHHNYYFLYLHACVPIGTMGTRRLSKNSDCVSSIFIKYHLIIIYKTVINQLIFKLLLIPFSYNLKIISRQEIYIKNSKKMYLGSKLRTGFSMKVSGAHLTRPDLHILAAELGITTRDILIENEILTIYNTSKVCQEIIDDNALVSFVSIILNIPPDDISELNEVAEEPVEIEFDFGEDDDDK